jgi:hypothetical protein
VLLDEGDFIFPEMQDARLVFFFFPSLSALLLCAACIRM